MNNRDGVPVWVVMTIIWSHIHNCLKPAEGMIQPFGRLFNFWLNQLIVYDASGMIQPVNPFACCQLLDSGLNLFIYNGDVGMIQHFGLLLITRLGFQSIDCDDDDKD